MNSNARAKGLSCQTGGRVFFSFIAICDRRSSLESAPDKRRSTRWRAHAALPSLPLMRLASSEVTTIFCRDIPQPRRPGSAPRCPQTSDASQELSLGLIRYSRRSMHFVPVARDFVGPALFVPSLQVVAPQSCVEGTACAALRASFTERLTSAARTDNSGLFKRFRSAGS